MKRNDRQRLLAWSLLWLYTFAITTTALHMAMEAMASESVVVVCQDCAHHVHHGGHLSAIGHDSCNCLICQSATAGYVCPDIIKVPGPVAVACAAAPHHAVFCNDAAVSTQQARAPPAGKLM